MLYICSLILTSSFYAELQTWTSDIWKTVLVIVVIQPESTLLRFPKNTMEPYEIFLFSFLRYWFKKSGHINVKRFNFSFIPV